MDIMVSRRRNGMSGRCAADWFLAAGIVLILAAALPLGCGGDDDPTGPNGADTTAIHHPEDFLPPGTASMARDGAARVATDIPGLQDIVNGGYEVYTGNGFREMVEQNYSGTVGETAATMKVWIFDVTTPENAVSLNDELLQSGAWEELNQVGEQDNRQSSLFAYTLLFRRNQYSVRLEISTNTQNAKDLLLLFATHIDTEIQG